MLPEGLRRYRTRRRARSRDRGCDRGAQAADLKLFCPLVPAKAGIQFLALDSRLCENGWESVLTLLLFPTALLFLFLRNLLAFAARFGKPDRDRLLAACHLLSAAAALERAALALAHCALDFLRRPLGIFSRHLRFLNRCARIGADAPLDTCPNCRGARK